LTCSLVSSVTLDLLLAIHSKVAKEISDVSQWTSVDVSENISEYCLSYAIPKTSNAFCVLYISVSQYEPPELFFEVYADYEYLCLKDGDGYKTCVDDLMSRYAHIKPVLTKGFVNYFDTDENEKINLKKSTAKPSFKVKYMLIQDIIDGKENYHDSYGFDEMANDIFPYIKSVYEISKIIHPNSTNPNGGVIKV